MPNREHVDLLKQGVGGWNRWRRANPEVRPDLSQDSPSQFEADVRAIEEMVINQITKGRGRPKSGELSGLDLTNVNLSRANLANADLNRATLTLANLSHTDLRGANLSGCILTGADLRGADLTHAKSECSHSAMGESVEGESGKMHAAARQP